MSKEKAQHLIALLGDRKESVLSLLSEEDADYLRKNMVKANTINPLEIDELIQGVLQKSETSPETFMEAPATKLEDTTLFEEPLDHHEEDLATDIVEASFDGDLGEGNVFGEMQGDGRDYKSVADVLEQQSPELVSFFLNKLTEDKRDSLLEHLPTTFQDDLQTLAVEDIPISDEIFEELYNELFKGWN